MKSLRIFADHCVPTSIVRFLREQDHEVFQLRDFILKNSPDPLVIQTAKDFNAILLSLNGDFADIVNYPPENYPEIIGIQLKNHPEVIPEILQRLQKFLTEHPKMEDYTGKLFLVEPHRIRIRG